MYRFSISSGTCVATDRGYVPVEYLSVKDWLLTRNGAYPVVAVYPEFVSTPAWEYRLHHCQAPLCLFGDNYALGDDGSDILLRVIGEPILRRFVLLNNESLCIKYFPALTRMYLFTIRHGYTATRLMRLRRVKVAHQLSLRTQYLLRGFPEQMPRGLLGAPRRAINRILPVFQERLARHKCDFCSLVDALHVQELLTCANIPHTIRVAPSRIYATANVPFFSPIRTGILSDSRIEFSGMRYCIDTLSPEIAVNGIIILG